MLSVPFGTQRHLIDGKPATGLYLVELFTQRRGGLAVVRLA
jgi:hypothetical protein